MILEHQEPVRLTDLTIQPLAAAAALEQAARFDPATWTQGNMFQNDRGQSVDYFSPKATRWTAGGFILLALRHNRQLFRDLMRICEAALAEQPGQEYDHLHPWNDAPGRTPAEVKTFLLDTAARLRREVSTAPIPEE